MPPSHAPLKNAAELERFRTSLRNDVRKLAGIAAQPGGPAPRVRVHRSMQREGYRLELVSLEMDGGVPVAGSLAIPAGDGPHPALVLADARPKEQVAGAGGDLDASGKQGFLVLAIQPRGTPERAPATANLLGDYSLAYQAYLVSRSLTGIRSEDIIRSIDYLTSRRDVRPGALSVVGYGAAGVYVLHAAALDERIAHVVTQQSPALLRLAVERPIHRQIYEVAVPGMLTKYDMDDLLTAIHPRKVTVVNPVDLLQRQLHVSEYRRMIGAAIQADEALGSPHRLDVLLRGRQTSLPLVVR